MGFTGRGDPQRPNCANVYLLHFFVKVHRALQDRFARAIKVACVVDQNVDWTTAVFDRLGLFIERAWWCDVTKLECAHASAYMAEAACNRLSDERTLDGLYENPSTEGAVAPPSLSSFNQMLVGWWG